MIKNSKLTAFGLTGLVALTVAAGSVQASQLSNNDYRNLATVGGVVAGIGIANHNTTETLLGAAGAIYSLSQIQPGCQTSYVQPTNYVITGPQRDSRDQNNWDRNSHDRDNRNDKGESNNRNDNHDRR